MGRAVLARVQGTSTPLERRAANGFELDLVLVESGLTFAATGAFV